MSDNEKNPNEDMDEDTVGEEVSNADLLSLMKTYMNNKIAGLEKNLNDSTHSFAKKKKRPNKAISYLEDSKELLNKRNKYIRIADKSAGGWQTVSEYLSDELASDSEDEKRIRAADSRAVKKLKAAKTEKQQHGRKRPAEAAGSSYQQAHSGGNSGGNGLQLQPFRAWTSAGGAQGQQSPAKPSDVCYKCRFYSHWARECRRQSKNRVPRAPPS
ncbi:Hypothetical predicted protein [Mytilus galloprovincialis]|uniref:CCHC-type domain-containing protein n=1 Tax=Mytilus galloprovincialis TaxID=29158 RepID=A0A8B6GDX5_MYTGA|nr:Hypothetical predicted protein [Mytilus galloprovincialis]